MSEPIRGARRLLALLAVAAVAAGCAGGDANGEGAGESEAGYSPWTTRVEMRVGDAEGPGALSSVFAVVETPDGGVVVTEPQFGRVVAFASDGTFSAIVAERGEGPGEVGIPGAVFVLGDTLVVSDFQRAALHLFGPDFTFIDQVAFRIATAGSSFGGRPTYPFADGSVGVVAPATPASAPGGGEPHDLWLRADRQGVVVDTLLVIPAVGRSLQVEHMGRPLFRESPVDATALANGAPDGSGLVVVHRPLAAAPGPATLTVLRLGPSGDTLALAEVPYEAQAFTPAHRDSVAERLARGAPGVDPEAGDPRLAQAIREAIPAAPTWPGVDEVALGADGSVWLRARRGLAEQAVWWVLDAELRPTGRVELPVDARMVQVGLERIWTVELDSRDVPSVVRRRVRAAGR